MGPRTGRTRGGPPKGTQRAMELELTFDKNMKPLERKFLGNADEIQKAMDAVASQGKSKE